MYVYICIYIYIERERAVHLCKRGLHAIHESVCESEKPSSRLKMTTCVSKELCRQDKVRAKRLENSKCWQPTLITAMEKSPENPQKSPVSPVPLQYQKDPTYLQKSSVYRHWWRRCPEALYIRKRSCNFAKETYISAKETYIAAKELYKSVYMSAYISTKAKCSEGA